MKRRAATWRVLGLIIAGAKRCSVRDAEEHDAIYVTISTRGYKRFWCAAHLPEAAREMLVQW